MMTTAEGLAPRPRQPLTQPNVLACDGPVAVRRCDEDSHPEGLNNEVDALVEVLLAKNFATLQVTKYLLDKGADLDLAGSMIFEGAPARQLERHGIADFVEKGPRDQRRKLVMDFWQDRGLR
jgi:hypothetical protein